jgi:hypothetical protein
MGGIALTRASNGRIDRIVDEGGVDLPDGWRLSITRDEDGQYIASVEGQGRGVRTRARTSEEAVADLSTALGQADRVGVALRAYVLGGEKLMRHAIDEPRPVRRDIEERSSALAAPRLPDQPSDDPSLDWVSVRQAAVILGLSEGSVRRRIRKQQLPARRDDDDHSLVGLPHREPERIVHGRVFFAIFNPLTGIGAYAVGKAFFGDTALGPLAGIVVYAVFILGLAYTLGTAARSPLR